MPVSSLIVGVDLDKIKPIRGVTTLVGDITTPATAAALKRASRGDPFDVVLHDGAPNVGGAWSAEAYGQSALVLDAAKLAAAMLAPGGTFVTKVFRSKDYTALLFAFRALFDRVDATKPAASRSASAEIFVVCRGYKAPAKLDPRLLDARHLFKDTSGGAGEEGTVLVGPAALLGAKMKASRARGGYDDGARVLRRTAPAAAFIAAVNPVEVLGRYTALVVDGATSVGAPSDVGQPGAVAPVDETAASAVATHPATTAVVRELCADLGVLGRSEFKALLKWRTDVRKTLEAAAKAAAKEAAAAAVGGDAAAADADADADSDSSDAELDAMAAAKDRADAAAKRAKRRAREAKAKARRRAAAAALGEGIVDDAAPDGEGLFSLSAVKGARAAAGLADADAPDSDAAEEEEAEDDDVSAASSDSETYAADREAALDDLYSSYLVRARGLKAAKEEAIASERRGLKRARLADAAGPEFGSDDDGGGDAARSVSPSDSDAPAGGGLLVGAAPATAAARHWYGDGGAGGLFAQDDASDDDERARRTVARRKVTSAAAPTTPTTAVNDGPAGFEVVPQDDSDIDLDTTDDEGGDPDARDDAGLESMHPYDRAETLALARAALRGRRRTDIIDAGYIRHAHNDPPGSLPRWFADDERRHARPPRLVTAEEVAAERAAGAHADARPIKKVAQAKARKAKRLTARLEAARKKAEAVAGNDELGARGKAREVEKIMAAARKGRGAKKVKQSRSAKFSSDKKAKPLDRRQRADARGAHKMKGKHAAKAGGKKGGKGGKKGGRR